MHLLRRVDVQGRASIQDLGSQQRLVSVTVSSTVTREPDADLPMRLVSSICSAYPAASPGRRPNELMYSLRREVQDLGSLLKCEACDVNQLLCRDSGGRVGLLGDLEGPLSE